MKVRILLRKVHYWLAAIIALPLALVIGTGILLQVKKYAPWVQPTERGGASEPPALSLPELLEIAAAVPQAEIKTWDDVYRVDFRPSRNLIKVIAENSWEIQIDSATGEVLQVAYRRSDLIESFHDGSWFGNGVRYGVFLPVGGALSILWLTGLYLFLLPMWTKRKARSQPQVMCRET